MLPEQEKNIYALLGKAEAILTIVQDYLKTDPKKLEIGKNILLQSIEELFKEIRGNK